ncbi:MAG: hypothetical protein R3236_09900, partial [Phycisphaeraceae bacterium]|nr:hypothetical protein [Phycisphaeraceae bacterium]
VVLGPTGRNFAAGMSGGVAYVLDGTRDFRQGRCVMGGIEMESITDPVEAEELRTMVQTHLAYTGSSVADWVLENWESALAEFVKVIPTEYRDALRRLEDAEASTELNPQHAAA